MHRSPRRGRRFAVRGFAGLVATFAILPTWSATAAEPDVALRTFCDSENSSFTLAGQATGLPRNAEGRTSIRVTKNGEVVLFTSGSGPIFTDDQGQVITSFGFHFADISPPFEATLIFDVGGVVVSGTVPVSSPTACDVVGGLPPLFPADKEECKQEGHETFFFHFFKNQGDCIKFFREEVAPFI